MRKFVIAVAIFIGACVYIDSHYQFSDIMVYAHKNPQLSWASAADYYSGVIYYQRSEYPKAQEALTQLLTDYSTGTYHAQALLLLSDAAGENRDWTVARQSLERFLEEFPDHKNRRIAEQRLDAIKFR